MSLSQHLAHSKVVSMGGFSSQLFKMEVESRVEEKQRHQQQETWMDLPTPGKAKQGQTDAEAERFQRGHVEVLSRAE